MKKVLLLICITLMLSGCWFCDSDLNNVILNDSEVVYVIEQGKLNYYDKDGQLVKSVSAADVNGWYVLSPGNLSKLIKAKLDKELPKEPE